jgi:hypothetical protein
VSIDDDDVVVLVYFFFDHHQSGSFKLLWNVTMMGEVEGNREVIEERMGLVPIDN